MIVEKDGRACQCGKKGCFEMYASMKALKTALRQRWQQEFLSSKKIVERLQSQEEVKQVEDILQNYISYLSIGIANITRICSTNRLAIGGGFVHYQNVLMPRLQQELNHIMTKKEKQTLEVVPAKLGNDAAMIGVTLF